MEEEISTNDAKELDEDFEGSNEINNVHGFDEERKRLPELNTKTNMVNPQFVKGMALVVGRF